MARLFDGGMFQHRQPAPGVYPEKRPACTVMTKEQKWGKYKEEVLQRISLLEAEG